MQALDRQVLYVVQAIRDVAATLEARRAAMRKAGGESPEARSRALDDIDRLSNLVSLATSMPQNELQAATRRALDDTLGELRHRVSRLGTALTIARIRDLRTVAEEAARRQEHPLGKSFILRRQFTRYVGYLLGLTEGLTPEHEDDVRSTAAAINALIDVDHRRGALESFADDAILPPIDMGTLAFVRLDADAAEIEEAA
jgi:hypothetical protein